MLCHRLQYSPGIWTTIPKRLLFPGYTHHSKHIHPKVVKCCANIETEINIPVVNVDPLFNDHVTTDEMLKLVRTLRNNKSSSNDQVLNEFFKYSPPKVIDMMVRLFNVLLDTGIFPEQ